MPGLHEWRASVASIAWVMTRAARRFVVTALLCIAAAPASAQSDGSLRVMTFNLRFASDAPPNAWHDRRPVVREVIERSAPDLIGTQEGLYSQIMHMDTDLSGYAWIGLGREGGSRGEFMAVFYRTERLAPLEFDHFWLSDSPELIGSMTWGNRFHRMVTWVRFRDLVTDAEFYLINTHFDHEVQVARERSAQLILDRTAAFDSTLPIILLGDFNADARTNRVHDVLVRDGGFVDTWTAAGHDEPEFGTFHSFSGVDGARGRGRIDWILVRGAVCTTSSEILTFARDGQFPSDHFPVVASLRLAGTDREECPPAAGSRTSRELTAEPIAASVATEAFLDTLQQRTFNFFWETANPRNGLIPDRWPTPSFSSVAAIGFGLSAYPVGIERGWITRDQGIERVLTTLRFLWHAPQGPQPTGVTGYRGFFYHFLDMQTGHRYREVELSTIDTMLLLAGALFCAEYFDGSDPRELEIRSLADSLYLRVEWNWVGPQAPLIGMGWHPETGFIPHSYRGYDEASLLYIMALGSPTHPVEPAAWAAFTSSHPWHEFYGYEHVNFAPLFGHQYSHVWVDFRGIRDDYMKQRGFDYFENSRRATLAQREYAIDNPMGWRGYGADVWGLTASDGPANTVREVNGEARQFWSYRARGAAVTRIEDDGTIAPTAAGGSIPFAPEVTIPALRAMRERYGEHLFGEYGFFDAFNPTFQWTDVSLQHGHVVPGVGWFDTDYLGIDQGPILLMAENQRTELVWRYMRRNPHIIRGLRRAGFTGGWLDDA